MIELHTPVEDDLDALFRFNGQVFAEPWKPEDRQRTQQLIELDRFRIAVAGRRDGQCVVGVAGAFALEMTVPGGGALPTGGVTFVAVATTHRRQGLLTRLMDEIHRDIDARGEPLAALTASEAGIYERFGYGVATLRRVTTIDRRRARLRPEHRPPSTVRAVEWDDPALPAELVTRWERVRRSGAAHRSSLCH